MKKKTEQPKKTRASFYSPRPYLSWSQIDCFERSPDKFVERYLYGQQEDNAYLALGKKLSNALELGEECDDADLNHLITFFPRYPKHEHRIEAVMPGIEVPLIGVLDGCDPSKKFSKLGEYKSGKDWNELKAQKHGQLKMYNLIWWLNHKKLFDEVMLHWARTEWVDGELKFTGEIKSFPVQHSLSDVLLFGGRVRKAWIGIKKLTKAYYKQI